MDYPFAWTKTETGNGQNELVKAAIVALFLAMGDDDHLAIFHFAGIVLETGIMLIFADLFAVRVELDLAAVFSVTGTAEGTVIPRADRF